MNIALLSKICEVPGAPGHESQIRQLVMDTIRPYVDELSVDNMGNLYAFKKGSNNPENKKVMIAAHMDEIGFIITGIDEKGYLRFNTLGGFDPKTLTAQRVLVHGKKDIIGVMGSKPLHVMSPEERNAVAKIGDYFIDCGMTKEEISKYVRIGDVVTRERSLVEMGDCVNCKSIDNRVSVFILIEAMRELKNAPYDVYAVFTVQEEMGARGAVLAAHRVNPDFAFGLDTTIAFDTPGARDHEMVTRLGAGTAVKIMDSSVISDKRLVDYLENLADANDIPYQREILSGGNTDTGPMQRSGKEGAIAGALSIPTRHIHQVIEMAHKKDVQATIDLLRLALQNLDKRSWKW